MVLQSKAIVANSQRALYVESLPLTTAGEGPPRPVRCWDYKRTLYPRKQKERAEAFEKECRAAQEALKARPPTRGQSRIIEGSYYALERSGALLGARYGERTVIVKSDFEQFTPGFFTVQSILNASAEACVREVLRRYPPVANPPTRVILIHTPSKEMFEKLHPDGVTHIKDFFVALYKRWGAKEVTLVSPRYGLGSLISARGNASSR